MKLKIDENGHAALENGMPVYVYEDGSEKPFDAKATVERITALGAEAKNHRLSKEEAHEKLKLFEGIDPAAARKALDTIANLDAKKLIDAGEVETLKRQMGEIFDTEKKELVNLHEAEKKTFNETVEKLTGTIRDTTIKTHFAQSPFFSGEAPKTILPPDMAATYFGDRFRVEGEGPNVKLVGYLNGEKIPSKINYGQEAGFEEALSVIIDHYPMKERILRTGPGGSGSTGNFNQGNGSAVILSKADSRDPVKYQAAKAQAEKSGLPLQIER